MMELAMRAVSPLAAMAKATQPQSQVLLVNLLLAWMIAHGFAFADSETNASGESWFAFGVGLTSVEAQLGFYDLGGSQLDARIVAGYFFEGGLFLQADALWFLQNNAGFYGGGGLGIVVTGNPIFVGPHLTVGGDIPLNASSGILIDVSLGFYPLVLRYEPPELPSMLFPIFARFSVGYRVLM